MVRSDDGGICKSPPSSSTSSLGSEKGNIVKTLAFVIGLLIVAVGAVGIIAPSCLVWIAEHSVTSGALYVIATVRVAFGLLLISAASVSRAPKTLLVLGCLILIAGITTALTALVAMERAQAMIDWWLRHEPIVRLTGIPLLALGGFIAYTCAPARCAA
jgi:hypothetical protein